MGTVLQLNPIIPRGTTIQCPECHKTLYTYVRNVRKGRVVSSNALEPRPQARAGMQCECGTLYGLVEDGEIKLHTAHGWMVATA